MLSHVPPLSGFGSKIYILIDNIGIKSNQFCHFNFKKTFKIYWLISTNTHIYIRAVASVSKRGVRYQKSAYVASRHYSKSAYVASWHYWKRAYVARAARNFWKKAVKSTIFVLQQSFLHIFGVAQNFQLNGEGLMAQKGGGVRPPWLRPCSIYHIQLD